jgi:hypothetical protein
MPLFEFFWLNHSFSIGSAEISAQSVPATLKKPGFLPFLAKNPSHIFKIGVPISILGVPKTILGLPEMVPGLPEVVLGLPNFISGVPFLSLGVAETISGNIIFSSGNAKITSGNTFCSLAVRTRLDRCEQAGAVETSLGFAFSPD